MFEYVTMSLEFVTHRTFFKICNMKSQILNSKKAVYGKRMLKNVT